MPRIEETLGEVAQAPRGAVRSSTGSNGAGLNTQNVESRKNGFVPARPMRRRCCKTCKGTGCVGYCKY